MRRGEWQTHLDGQAGLERFDAIKDAAFARRVREHVLPSPEVLVARLADLGQERAQAQAQLEQYRGILEQLQAKLCEPCDASALQAWLRERLAIAAQAGQAQPLLAQESFLRIMSAHVQVRPSGHEFFVEGRDSLLQAGLTSGLKLNYGCGNGTCGLCKARVVSGSVAKTMPYDYPLSEAERLQGYTLLCAHSAASSEIVIEALEALGPKEIPAQEIGVVETEAVVAGGRSDFLRIGVIDAIHASALEQCVAIPIQSGCCQDCQRADSPTKLSPRPRRYNSNPL